MAETQKASIGWAGEVWLHDGTALYELVQVTSFGLPSDTVDRVETTHLKSPNRRREYVSGLVDGGEVEVVLNFRPGSTTDTLLETALATGDSRACKFVVPIAGTPVRDYTTTAIVTGYERGPVTAEDAMEATVTLAITGAVTAAVHS